MGGFKKKRASRNGWTDEWLENYFTLDEVVGALQAHPTDCVFELGAPQNILDRLSVRPRGEWLSSKEFKNCFIQSEIYCPHECVDRRAEYGMKVE
jgi:hypothetical protein